ncbi:MAG: hypothetical protein M4579_006941 [Chaenotheca gracillima]|nr:MAG: hypothetical protein M4579_006941 [Chaenotheca gracillima]
MPLPLSNASTGVAITNPLVLYRALVATNRIDPDPSQHRLALHLQKLYFRLKDYEPEIEYDRRLKQISKVVGKPALSSQAEQDDGTTNAPSRPARRGILSAVMAKKEQRDTLAMTRVMTSHEAALNLDSPQGLLLHGEVGTGKSMLVDLLADSLPNRKKRRWHFNTFMLETLAQFEELRRSQMPSHALVDPAERAGEEEYSMLRLARDMISTSPILFLDEFQLPDRAASKILSNLLTCFFHLGGVLIATSNRMPDELSKASGMEFAPPSSTYGALGARFRGLLSRQNESASKAKSEFSGFLDVLKARCEVWDMEGGRDWRRREAEGNDRPDLETSESAASFDGLEDMKPGNLGLGYEQSTHNSNIPPGGSNEAAALPTNYFLKNDISAQMNRDTSHARSWEAAIRAATSTGSAPSNLEKDIPWKPATMHVYGRTVHIPRIHNGTTLWTFAELCEHKFGPADYLTLSSTYHTLILTDVPVLSLLQKNEARRLITLLDALYEARCKLLICAEAGPDDIFFPDSTLMSRTESPTLGSNEKSSMPPEKSRGGRSQNPSSKSAVSEADATYSETISEIEQDLTNPFRPNITAYEATSESTSFPFSSKRSILADEDSDFGPLYPDSEARQQDSNLAGPKQKSKSSFTGEDEMFAFKRARSRLWEMCGSRWWSRGSSPDDQDWWRPLPLSTRRWERSALAGRTPEGTPSLSPETTESLPSAGTRKDDINRENNMFRHGASPFRTSTEPPPKFSWVHAWGMMQWGRKAGKWGRGVDGMKDEDGSQEDTENKGASKRRGGGEKDPP